MKNMKKKLIKINEQKMHRIVKETIENFIKTNGYLGNTNRINVGNIVTIKNGVDFNKWADKVWDMLKYKQQVYIKLAYLFLI